MSTPTPGRRIAARTRPRPDAAVLAGVTLVILALVLLLVADGVEADHEPAPRATAVPVGETTVACAASPAPGRREVFTLAAQLPDAESEGRLLVGTAGEEPTQIRGARGERVDVEMSGRGDRAAVVVSATGGQALGRTTFQVDRARGGEQIAVQACPQPRSRWWFTGAGAGLDHNSVLTLVNLDPGPAVVDVLALGADGPVDSVGTRGITIGPGEMQTLDLVDVAPQADELAVHVEASRGRVVAAVADELSPGPAGAAGHEWLPGQSRPARELRLAPLPRRADRRTLLVANPGDREALVEVALAGEGGTFVPTGVGPVRVPPGTVVTQDLGDAVGTEPTALVLRSSVAVTASVRSLSGGGDHAYAVSVSPLRRPAAAVLAGSDAAVHLTAGQEAGTARITSYSAAGDRIDAEEVEVPAASTVSWQPARGAASVLVDPVAGRLWGGVALTGDGLSQIALRELPVTLRRPPVAPVVR